MARNYCFTAFEKKEVENLIRDETTKYLIYGEEICPETERLHYQGYVEFNKTVKISKKGKLKILCPTTHFEIRKGNQEQAINYCKKDGKFFEHGEPSRQGSRTDILEVKNLLDQGSRMKDVADLHFPVFLRFERSLKSYISMTREKRNWKTELYIHWGESGTGKSYDAFMFNQESTYSLPKPNGQNVYFDGYDGEEIVIMDDFYGWIPWSLLLNLCDQYPLLVNTKGGTTPFLAKRIYITSNKRYNEWYQNIEDLRPLKRRITKEIHYIFENSDNVTGDEVRG